MKSNKEKCKKLEEKVRKLVVKLKDQIETLKKEKSPLKRLRCMVKCKMLVNYIQRQQDLLKAKKQFEQEREENKFTAIEKKVAIRNKIIELNTSIKYLEKELSKEKEYDVNSEKFIFPQEEVEIAGGIEQYADELTESGEPEQIETAERIKQNIKYRRLLKDRKKDLKEQKEYLADINFDLKLENSDLSRKEMIVTAKSKFNIFAKARNFLSSIWYGIKEFREEAKENREVDRKKVKDFNEMQLEYEKVKEKIRMEYEQKVKELKETYEAAEGGKTAIWDKHYRERATKRRSKQAARFQEKLQNMTKAGDEFVDGTNKDDEEIKEETEEERNVGGEEQSQGENRVTVRGQNHDENVEEIETWEGEVINTPDDDEICH